MTCSVILRLKVSRRSPSVGTAQPWPRPEPMEILERPAYQPLWDSARRRIEANGLSLDGSPLHLKGLTAEEVDAITGLLGIRRPPPGAPLRVSLAALDRCLRTSAVGRGLL